MRNCTSARMRPLWCIPGWHGPAPHPWRWQCTGGALNFACRWGCCGLLMKRRFQSGAWQWVWVRHRAACPSPPGDLFIAWDAAVARCACCAAMLSPRLKKRREVKPKRIRTQLPVRACAAAARPVQVCTIQVFGARALNWPMPVGIRSFRARPALDQHPRCRVRVR